MRRTSLTHISQMPHGLKPYVNHEDEAKVSQKDRELANLPTNNIQNVSRLYIQNVG